MDTDESNEPATSGVLAAYPPTLRAELAALKAASEGAQAFVAYCRELCKAVTDGDRATAEALLKLLFSGSRAPGIIPGWTESFGHVKHLIEAVPQPVVLSLPDCQNLYRRDAPGGRTRPEWFTPELESRLDALEKVIHRDRFSTSHEAAAGLASHLVSVMRAVGLSPDDLHLSDSRWDWLKLCLTPLCKIDLTSLGDALKTEWTDAAVRARDNFRFFQQVSPERGGDDDDQDADGLKRSRVTARPPKVAFRAWFTRDVLGVVTQQQIADEMTRQGCPATQGQVSKWLRAVERYREASGIMPTVDELEKPDTETWDPAIIDMGPRQDGLTPRQRPRRDDDADSWSE